jgi:hypothetical protein
MNIKDWDQIKYFDYYEFDSPDSPGSGKLMKGLFIDKLNSARSKANIPFKINSGYRTIEHNKKVGGSKNSSHLKGWAADIRVKNNKERRLILNSLISVGLDSRIGISNTFIHVDCDPTKDSSYWTYGGKNTIKSLIKNIFYKNEPEDI